MAKMNRRKRESQNTDRKGGNEKRLVGRRSAPGTSGQYDERPRPLAPKPRR